MAHQFLCFPVFITEKPLKKDEPFREDRRKIDPSGAPPRGGNPIPKSGPVSRSGQPAHPPPGTMGLPGSYGGSSSHKDIKLTLLNKVTIASPFISEGSFFFFLIFKNFF